MMMSTLILQHLEHVLCLIKCFQKGSLVAAGRTSLSRPKRHICGVMKPLSPDTGSLSFYFTIFFSKTWCINVYTWGSCFTELRKAFVSELALQEVPIKGTEGGDKEKVVKSDSERFVGLGNL